MNVMRVWVVSCPQSVLVLYMCVRVTSMYVCEREILFFVCSLNAIVYESMRVCVILVFNNLYTRVCMCV
jgi:hypothetical protein